MSTADLPELLPCPFCGGSKLMLFPPTCTPTTLPYTAADRAFPVMHCKTCNAEVPGANWDQAGKSAFAAWNTRAGDKRAREAVEALLTPAMLEVGRKAIEDVLIEYRDARISELQRGNGLVVKERDGTPSDVIRMGPETALGIALRAMAASPSPDMLEKR